MLKTIEAKTLLHESPLGQAVFSNVPVSVDASVDPATFDPEADDYGLRGDVIEMLDREIAKRWIREFLRQDVDGNYPSRLNLSAEHVKGIRLILGVNGTELGELLGLGKAKISKVLRGEQRLTLPATKGLLNLLIAELRAKGVARSMIETQPKLKDLKPEDDFHEIQKRA